MPIKWIVAEAMLSACMGSYAGAATDHDGYPFLDIAALGLGKSLVNIALLAAGFLSQAQAICGSISVSVPGLGTRLDGRLTG